MTSIATSSPVERIARVIAAEALSPHGEDLARADVAVSTQVDTAWQDGVERALAVLRTLREPSHGMIAAGRTAGSDPAEIWNAMVRAAIEEHDRLVMAPAG